ncbi:hypothetical protein Q4485_08630 [Granulosicoccaceae sp. 1_MG-2023]|nr:hypothetical protein [Granulosicoccaceae sp. 1_MG-2023]
MKARVELNDLRKLVRAYGVLAGSCDAERAIAGKISRRWIASEVERMIPLSSLPYAFFFTTRGREIIASEFFAGQDIDPTTIDPDSVDIAGSGDKIYINSNRIPKLEPMIDASVVAANLLLGVQLYGKRGKGVPDITHDALIAAMLQFAMNRRHRYSTLRPGNYAKVDAAMVLETFGESVLDQTLSLQTALQAFIEAHDKGEPPPADLSPVTANSVAAILVSRLRLSARAAGDAVLSYVSPLQREELLEKGIDPDVEFAERPFMQRDFELAEKALAMPQVDHAALREPIRSTLMTAVKDALEQPSKRFRLAGRRGKAVHDVHINMPVMEYYVAAEEPNALATLHVASLEMMRYLEKGRRKSYSTMLAHAFRLTSFAERALGSVLEPGIATIALLHDVVEDGSSQVTGYDQSLQKIMFRFGGPIAAMVSEVTDSTTKQAALQKAMATFNHPQLMLPSKQYNTGRLNKMPLIATDADRPYTLAGIIVKLIDTIVSFDEGIRDPDLMSGWWCHSGVRIYWAERVRGAIIKPLLERLVREIVSGPKNDDDSEEAFMTRSQLRRGISLIALILDYADMYAAQNLAILAREYDLSRDEREALIRDFFNPEVPVEQYQQKMLDEWLTEPRLEAQIRAGVVPARSYVALYPRTKGAMPHRDISTFHEYIHSARRRVQIRQELGWYTPRRRVALQSKLNDVVFLYDYRMAHRWDED